MAIKMVSLGILNNQDRFVGATSVKLDTSKKSISDIEESLRPEIPVKGKSISGYRFTTDPTGQELKYATWIAWDKNKKFKGDFSKGGYLQIKLDK